MLSEMSLLEKLFCGIDHDSICVFDYGCGRGDDIEFLQKLPDMGWVDGYDPNHKPDPKPWELSSGDYHFVTSFYVLNVLPNMDERYSVLKEMMRLVHPNGAVVVATRSKKEVERAKTDEWEEYSDGYLTPTGTFQRGFTAGELAEMLIEVGCEIVVPLASYGDYVMVAGSPNVYEFDDCPF